MIKIDSRFLNQLLIGLISCDIEWMLYNYIKQMQAKNKTRKTKMMTSKQKKSDINIVGFLSLFVCDILHRSFIVRMLNQSSADESNVMPTIKAMQISHILAKVWHFDCNDTEWTNETCLLFLSDSIDTNHTNNSITNGQNNVRSKVDMRPMNKHWLHII